MPRPTPIIVPGPGGLERKATRIDLKLPALIELFQNFRKEKTTSNLAQSLGIPKGVSNEDRARLIAEEIELNKTADAITQLSDVAHAKKIQEGGFLPDTTSDFYQAATEKRETPFGLRTIRTTTEDGKITGDITPTRRLVEEVPVPRLGGAFEKLIPAPRQAVTPETAKNMARIQSTMGTAGNDVAETFFRQLGLIKPEVKKNALTELGVLAKTAGVRDEVIQGLATPTLEEADAIVAMQIRHKDKMRDSDDTLNDLVMRAIVIKSGLKLGEPIQTAEEATRFIEQYKEVKGADSFLKLLMGGISSGFGGTGGGGERKPGDTEDIQRQINDVKQKIREAEEK